MKLSDYKIEKSFTSTPGECYIATSKIDGKKYFIKRNVSLTNNQLEKKHLLCHELAKLDSFSRKLILFPYEIFIDNGKTYEVLAFFDCKELNVIEVPLLSEIEKVTIMLCLTKLIINVYSLGIGFLNLNKQGIIVCRSSLGGYCSYIDGSNNCCLLSEEIDKNFLYNDFYISPEIAQSSQIEGKSINYFYIKKCVFFLGLIFYEWWTGRILPFKKKDAFVAPYMIIEEICPSKIAKSSKKLDTILNLILNMVCPYPDKRPTLDETYSTLKKYYEICKKGNKEV